MKTKTQKAVEFPRMTRSLNTWKGKMFQYLLENHLSGKSGTEIVEDTVSAFWMPMVMKKHGVSGEELKEASLWAIEQLVVRIGTIVAISDLKTLPPTLLSTLSAVAVPVASVETTSVTASDSAESYIQEADSEEDEEFAEVEVEEDALWGSMSLG